MRATIVCRFLDESMSDRNGAVAAAAAAAAAADDDDDDDDDEGAYN